ncbi:MAG: HEPN domain-containing protein [Deltaproteobacteria bacterium]|nr:HEPN domain-containing protein [Deltaproteobacteria bacterium]
MTDKETLLAYRLREARETLTDAQTLLEGSGTPRTVINRSYYATFYAVLALFVKEGTDIRTSKHAGVIALFNKEFVHTGRIAVEYSRTLQRLFDARQESDYKEFVENTKDEARKFFDMAEAFLAEIERFSAAVG